MKNGKIFLGMLFLAVFAPAVAHAEIVSGSFLNKRLGTNGDLGTLATKDAVSSADIIDGTITSADISDIAGITQGQLSAEVSAILNAVAGKATTVALDEEISARGDADTTLQANIDKKQDKLATGDDGNITGAGSVSVSVEEDGKLVISGTDTNTVTTATMDGTGNVVSEITATDGALTVTKGINAVTRASTAAVGDSTHAVYVDANGAVQKVDKVADAASADYATTATNAKKICHTSACSSYVDVWVE